VGAAAELCFAEFEVSLPSGELRRNGLKVKLQEQPFQILVLLLEQQGQVVTREELRQKLWTADTFVDFDNGLNIAIKKLRAALGDDADAPRYIETLPRRGYRFIAPVAAGGLRGVGSGDATAPLGVNAGVPQWETESGRAVMETGLARSSVQRRAPVSAPAGSGSVPLAEGRRHKGKLIGAAVVIATFVVAAALGAYKLLKRNTLTVDTHNISLRPLTDHGQAVYASISPDGRLLAYVMREGERSLRVKQVATGSEVTVVPAQAGFFASAPTFTPDGNYLYYTHANATNGNITDVYAVPSLGGASRQIVSDVASPVAFSPDGKRMTYLRTLGQSGEKQVLVANTDGSDERVIQRRESREEDLFTNPSWSASGDLIAIGAVELGKNTLGSILVITPKGKLVKSFSLPMAITQVAWLPDSSGLFFIGGEKSPGRNQVWFQPYPEGKHFKITNDLSQYREPSVTADGKSFVTTQERTAAAIYVGDSPALLNDKIDWKLAPISTQQATGYFLSWTAAGKLLQEDFTRHVYVSGSDGSSRVGLLANDEMADFPNACGPGDVVVVARVLENNTPNLWRLNVATNELKQLTFEKGEDIASCAPDGKWVVYRGLVRTDALEHIFKVSLDGGAPVELAHGNVTGPVVSPDGTLVVYGRVQGQGAGQKRVWVVQKLEDGTLVREFEVPASDNWLSWQILGWTPDGHALTYVHNTSGNAQNVYMQPLTGGAPVQLTHFDSEPALVSAYAWSRDGKKFAITRARYNDTDVVMFSNFR
jgi:Tol biopolymer transport system component/DNA-binding winged helix-turn-helix (wHTH) protein